MNTIEFDTGKVYEYTDKGEIDKLINILTRNDLYKYRIMDVDEVRKAIMLDPNSRRPDDKMGTMFLMEDKKRCETYGCKARLFRYYHRLDIMFNTWLSDADSRLFLKYYETVHDDEVAERIMATLLGTPKKTICKIQDNDIYYNTIIEGRLSAGYSMSLVATMEIKGEWGGFRNFHVDDVLDDFSLISPEFCCVPVFCDEDAAKNVLVKTIQEQIKYRYAQIKMLKERVRTIMTNSCR